MKQVVRACFKCLVLPLVNRGSTNFDCAQFMETFKIEKGCVYAPLMKKSRTDDVMKTPS